jgi:hypothetical protein
VGSTSRPWRDEPNPRQSSDVAGDGTVVEDTDVGLGSVVEVVEVSNVEVEACGWEAVVVSEHAPTAVAPMTMPPASFRKSRLRTAADDMCALIGL